VDEPARRARRWTFFEEALEEASSAPAAPPVQLRERSASDDLPRFARSWSGASDDLPLE